MATTTPRLSLPRPVGTDTFTLASQQALIDAIDSGAASLTELQSLGYKNSVRAATIGNITLSGTQTIDGIALIAGDRVLVKAQSTASQNGIYVVATGAWSRALDADTSAKVITGFEVWVSEGSTQADTKWGLVTNAPITLGTTGLSFQQIPTKLNSATNSTSTIEAATPSAVKTVNDAHNDLDILHWMGV
ncbi:phage tail protein [Cohnella silvisoli]|uniref:Tail fiber protein n=1 Tax=Cohnella silvisoli TaxID=2873699 RepID=A0ABV1KYX2_9BACL|nr:tail fiber protein [Cohnella silvisoli]MCD9024305.1 tail fiber protein [Cohnella silvisoli]